MVKHTSASVPDAVPPSQCGNNGTYGSAEEMLKRFFSDSNIQFDYDADDEKHTRGYDRYIFDYQGGHFVAFVYKTSDIDFFFPGIAEVPVEDLDIVRSVCNQRNIQSDFKFAYEIKKEVGKVAVHLTFYTEALAENSVSEHLSSFFEASRLCREQLTAAIEHAKSKGVRDVERVYGEQEREFFLIRNQEMAHGQKQVSSTVQSKDRSLTLGYLLRDLLDRTDIEISRLQVVDDKGLTTQEDSDNGFDDLNLVSLIIDKKSEHPAYLSSVVTVIATYHTHMNEGADEDQVFTLTLRKAGAAGNTAFFRMTLSLDSADASVRLSKAGPKNNAALSTLSLLLAYDFVSAEELRAEADYMWKDAQIKLSEGKVQELTDEQWLILDVTNANVAYNMYWGRKYMLSNRYFEAIAHLENAYHALRNKFFSLGKAEKNQFYELTYCLGYCHCELGLYEKAYYYLNLTRSIGNIKYLMEYVNVLANSGDIRVFSEIGMILDDLSKHCEGMDELPENVRQLESFLRRRYAFSLIEFGKLDDAEKAFKDLLNDPESFDYAVNELAYIKKLRQTRRGGLKVEDGEARGENHATGSDE